MEKKTHARGSALNTNGVVGKSGGSGGAAAQEVLVDANVFGVGEWVPPDEPADSLVRDFFARCVGGDGEGILVGQLNSFLVQVAVRVVGGRDADDSHDVVRSKLSTADLDGIQSLEAIEDGGTHQGDGGDLDFIEFKEGRDNYGDGSGHGDSLEGVSGGSRECRTPR